MHGSLNRKRVSNGNRRTRQRVESGKDSAPFWQRYAECHEKYLEPLSTSERRRFRLALGEAALAYARTRRLPGECPSGVRKCFRDLLSSAAESERRVLSSLVANAHAQMEFL